MAEDESSPAGLAGAVEQGPGRYEWSVARLVDRLKVMQSSDWSPTPTRTALRGIAAKLSEVVAFLELGGVPQSDIEDAHGDLFGEEGEAKWTAYSASLRQMHELLASINHADSRLPDARKRAALPFAADVFVFLRFHHGLAQPALTEDGPDVCEFESICAKSGIVLSRARLRGELSRARKAFKPFLFQPWHSNFV
jgi:hypothetical protein